MTKYNVHLFREMRLYYPGIEADSPTEAAKIASGTDSGEAEDIEDCNGEDLGALVDVDGDTDFANSELIDFEPQRERKAAAELLAALKEAIAEIEYAHADMLTAEEREHPRGSGWARVYDKAKAAIAQAKGSAI